MIAAPPTDRERWPVPTTASRALFERAARVVPGSVQGEGRSYTPYPLSMTRAEGSRIWDVDGNEYLDHHAAFGAVLLGHNHPAVRAAVERTLDTHGVTFSTAHPLEVELAERIVDLVPSAEKVVFSCTGSEATYHAVRLARAVTGREKLLKFEGNYHGWHDYVKWSVHFDPDREGGPPNEPEPVLESAGIPRAVRDTVVVCGYNDLDGLERAVRRHGHELAALVVEPVFHNAGVILPEPGFLELCRSLCTEAGIVLVFDEVITGFRLALGGAQELLDVQPDLTTMGKAVANGFPLSVLAGRAELMSRLVPEGDVFFSGTFYGHLLNVSAALACTEILRTQPIHGQLERLGRRLREGIQDAIDETGAKAQIRQLGSVWCLYFTDGPLRSFRDVSRFAKDKEDHLQRRYQRWLLGRGIYMHPMYVLRGYLTAAHTEEDVDRTVTATAGFLHEYREELV